MSDAVINLAAVSEQTPPSALLYLPLDTLDDRRRPCSAAAGPVPAQLPQFSGQHDRGKLVVLVEAYTGQDNVGGPAWMIKGRHGRPALRMCTTSIHIQILNTFTKAPGKTPIHSFYTIYGKRIRRSNINNNHPEWRQCSLNVSPMSLVPPKTPAPS